MDSEWIVGRKEIMAALHVDTWNSVRVWKDRAGIEFITWPNGSPAIQRAVFNEFIIKGSDFAQRKYNTRTLNLSQKMKQSPYGFKSAKRKQTDI